MSHLKFNHVFFGLMAISFLSAFALPRTITEKTQLRLQNVFSPIAWPAMHVSGWAMGKIFPPQIRDDGSPANPRSSAEVYAENDRLRVENAHLSTQLLRLEQREQAERTTFGGLRDWCTHFSVMGADSGTRKMLMLQGSSFDSIREGMPVLYPGGLVGKITFAGVAGVQVQLLTDRLSKVEATFARFIKQPGGDISIQAIPGQTRLLKGNGEDMLVQDIPAENVEDMKLQIGDWLLLDDPDWAALKGCRLGVIRSIVPSRTPGFRDIHVVPEQNLSKLHEVMVMNKEKG